ncbi:MAG: type VI secretion system baseplate subunit TssG, partial [Myxococcales bacterium]|nr:type VI secretion system baseplate subunit TssG [Myxococcales bacterium]
MGEREGARDPLARLLDRPGAFSFVAAASLLRGRGAEVRYRHDASLTHGGGELRAVREVAAAGEGPGERARPRYEVTASFLRAVGHAGPAPLYLAELAAAEDEAGELRRELLDVFHHRLYEILFTGLLGQDSLSEEILLVFVVVRRPPRRPLAPHPTLFAPRRAPRRARARAIALGL